MRAHRSLNRAAGHYHVTRTGLLDQIGEELSRSRIVFIRAPFGYGKSDVMRDFARCWRLEHGGDRPVVTIDCAVPMNASFITTYRDRRLAGQPMPEASYAACSCLVKKLGKKLTGAIAEELGMSMSPESAFLSRTAMRLVVPDDPLSHLVMVNLKAKVPDWFDRISQPTLSPDSRTVPGPLVLIDNLPCFDDDHAAGLFARSLREWTIDGASIIISCLPLNSFPDAQFSSAFILNALDMTVDKDEYRLWERDLCLDPSVDYLALTNGVPFLLTRAGLAAPKTSFVRTLHFFVALHV